MSRMRSVLKALTPAPIRRRVNDWVAPPDRYRMDSYAQEGEDRILARMIGPANEGFFVDVGAHHPRRYSNTYLFYLRGWRGINIDPQPGIMALFRQERPHDINLELAIAATRGQRNYYQFHCSELNGFSPTPAVPEAVRASYPSIGSVVVETAPLREILAAHLPPGRAINFLSVDVEGYDLEVLTSNDWARFRPAFVVAEAQGLTLTQLSAAPLTAFMSSQGYVPVARTYYSVIFRERTAAIVP